MYNKRPEEFTEALLECAFLKSTEKAKDFFKAYDTEGNAYVGNFPVEPNGRFKIWFTNGKKYMGECQRSVRRMVPQDDETAMQLVVAQGYVKGIGPTTAKNAYDKFGVYFINLLNACANQDPWYDGDGMLYENPFDALVKIKGIGKKKAMSIIANWSAAANGEYLERAMKDVMLGITHRQSVKLQDEYGPDYHDVIDEDPYALVAVLTFKEVDEIGQAKGIAKDDPRRIEGAAVYALNQAMNKGGRSGDMYCEYEPALAELRAILDVPVEKFPITSKIYQYADGQLTTLEKHLSESGIAFNAYNMVTEKPNPEISRLSGIDVQDYAPFELDPEQEKAVRNFLNCKISLVSGGPGTGKTSGVVATILNICRAHNLHSVLCAPTGIAAIVLQEATQHPAETCHTVFSLFEPGDVYTQAEGADFVGIDELSMMSSHDLARLMDRVPADAHLVLIGDPWQLPPVGAGEPFLQLIESGLVPHVELKTIHRQREGNGLIEAIHAIRNGIVPESNEDYDYRPIREHQLHAAIEKRLQWYEERGVGIEEILIVTPLNKTREGVNAWLQARFKKQDAVSTPDGKYNIGDRVMHLKNNRRLGVMNGQTGFVEALHDIGMQVDYSRKSVNTGSIIYEYDLDDYKMEVTLAYAVTVHKSQGDQAPYVIAYFPYVSRAGDESFMMRQLPYVAASRAQKRATVYASTPLEKYVHNERQLRRKSRLAQMMRERYEKAHKEVPNG